MAWQNKIKEKDALKLTFGDKVGKTDVINYGDVALIEISEKKDDPSPSKSDPPIPPAAKWHEVEPSIYQKVKNEEGTTIVAASGGLALTVKAEDSLPFPPDEEDERPTQGYQLNENKKDVNIEPEQPNPEDSYVFIPLKPYAHPPIMDQMPTDQRIALISDA